MKLKTRMTDRQKSRPEKIPASIVVEEIKKKMHFIVWISL